MKRKEFNKRARMVLKNRNANTNASGHGIGVRNRETIGKLLAAPPHTQPTPSDIEALENAEAEKQKQDAILDQKFAEALDREHALAESENREPRAMLVWMYDERVNPTED